MPEASEKPSRVLFVGHGSPMNAIQHNDYTASLALWGRTQPRPASIVVISAHWLTQGTLVSCQPQPRQIYDFYGFPEALYQVRYPCAGDPGTAKKIVELLKPEPGIRSLKSGTWNIAGGTCSGLWGIDHAAWAVLKHLYPRADIPVVEISLDMSKPPEYHYEIGKLLQPLREENVLILASGNLVHNLELLSWQEDDEPTAWAREMDQNLKKLLLAGDHAALMNYPQSGLHAGLGIPTLDHYLPLMYVLGLQNRGDQIRFIYEGIQNATVSMRCFTLA
jgi:4,5-DOPA dioxygenase extradiol